MNGVITQNELEKIIRELHNEHKKIVLVGGCFDLLHPAHIEFLNLAKKEGDILLILLESDEYIRNTKGYNRPHFNQNERSYILSQLKSVDYVLKLPYFKADEDYFRLVKIIKPAIIAITKNDPLTSVKKSQAEVVGGTVLEIMERNKKYSTSSLSKDYKME